MDALVYGSHWLSASPILDEVNRRLAGCDGPERWNPFRDVEISYKSWVPLARLRGAALEFWQCLSMSFH